MRCGGSCLGFLESLDGELALEGGSEGVEVALLFALHASPLYFLLADNDVKISQLLEELLADGVLERKVSPILTLGVVDERLLNASVDEILL